MRYMKPQTVIFGLTLQNIIRQNLKKAVRRGNVLRQGAVSADGLIIWYCVFASDACVVMTGVGSEWFSIVPISTVTLSLLIENSPL